MKKDTLITLISFAFFLMFSSLCFADDPGEPVVWRQQGLAGVVVDSNTLIKSHDIAHSWDVSGAASSQVIPAGQDGSLCFRALETSKFRTIGLSNQDADLHYSSIQYGFMLRAVSTTTPADSRTYRIYENGKIVYPPDPATNFKYYNTGALFSIERTIEALVPTIYYKVDGTIVYTSRNPTSASLMADVSLYDNGATAYNVRIEGAAVPEDIKVIAHSEKLYTEEDTAVNITLKSRATGDGAVTYEIVDRPRNGELTGSGDSYVYAPRMAFSGLDSFTFRAKDGAGNLSNLATVYIYVDGIAVDWVNEANVYIIDGNLLRDQFQSGTWGIAGASSQRVIDDNQYGAISFRAYENNTHRIIGLSHSDLDASGHVDYGYTSMDYAIHLYPRIVDPAEDGKIYIWEQGVIVFGSIPQETTYYHIGDEFKIERTITGDIVYYKNDAPFYTSRNPSWRRLRFDTALRDESAVVVNPVILRSDIPNTPFMRGDMNNDGNVNIADAISILGYIFAKGNKPTCMDTADVNNDSVVNIADAVSLLGVIFGNQPQPAAPWNQCGFEDNPMDGLLCLEYPPCE